MSENRADRLSARFAPQEPLAEQLVHMLVAMATELATTRERLDSLERLLDEASVLKEGGVDSFRPGADDEAARQQWREQFLDRLFEQLQGDITAARDADNKDHSA